MPTKVLDADKLRREGKLRQILSLVEVRYLRGARGYIKQILNKTEISLTFRDRLFYSLLRRHQFPGFRALIKAFRPIADPTGEKGFADTVKYLAALSKNNLYDPLRPQEWEQEARKIKDNPNTSELLQKFISNNRKRTKQIVLHKFKGSGLFSEINSLSESVTYAALLDCTLAYEFPAEQNEYSKALLDLLSPLEGVLFQLPLNKRHTLEDITETSHQWFNENKFSLEQYNDIFVAPYALAGEANRLILHRIGRTPYASIQENNRSPSRTRRHAYFIRGGDKIGTEAIPIRNQTIAQQIAKDHLHIRRHAHEQIIICGDDARACNEIVLILNKLFSNQSRPNGLADKNAPKMAIAHKQPHPLITSKGYSHRDFQDYSNREILKGIENMFSALNALLECERFSGDPLCNLVQVACRCKPMHYKPSAYQPFFP